MLSHACRVVLVTAWLIGAVLAGCISPQDDPAPSSGTLAWSESIVLEELYGIQVVIPVPDHPAAFGACVNLTVGHRINSEQPSFRLIGAYGWTPSDPGALHEALLGLYFTRDSVSRVTLGAEVKGVSHSQDIYTTDAGPFRTVRNTSYCIDKDYFLFIMDDDRMEHAWSYVYLFASDYGPTDGPSYLNITSDSPGTVRFLDRSQVFAYTHEEAAATAHVQGGLLSAGMDLEWNPDWPAQTWGSFRPVAGVAEPSLITSEDTVAFDAGFTGPDDTSVAWQDPYEGRRFFSGDAGPWRFWAQGTVRPLQGDQPALFGMHLDPSALRGAPSAETGLP